MTGLMFTELAGQPVALVPITNCEQRAIVDAADAPLVAGRTWRLHNDGYAHCHVWRDGADHSLRMHQLVLPVEPPLTVDHINGVRLDNRAVNLRPATRSQQQYNRGVPKNNRSGYKGVSLHRATGRWRAVIGINGERRHLGLYDDPADAANAYDQAALDAHGDFARTNLEVAS